MKWRIVPDLNLEVIKNCKCLLIGAGSLGCQVARNLLGWGVREIKFVDCGNVSYSNPVRQSLFTSNDIGKPKCQVAAEAIKGIFPSCKCEGHSLRIPMPGHVISSKEAEKEYFESCSRLDKLIEAADAVFLLTDSRESRWLPTVMCNFHKKICLTSALGYDTFVVMRHGLSATAHNNKLNGERLGCYFCNDIVAPIDSISERPLDQQCTVSRPALCTMASSIAVELLVSLLNHPLKNGAKANEDCFDESLMGILPQQIRGNLHNFKLLTLTGQSFKSYYS